MPTVHWAATPGEELEGRGFTLIELLVVIAIIGILATLLVPTAGKWIVQSQQARCVGNQRQVAAGLLMRAADENNTINTCVGGGPTTSVYFWTYQLQCGSGNTTNLKGYVPNGKVFRCPSLTTDWEKKNPMPPDIWAAYGLSMRPNDIGSPFYDSSKTQCYPWDDNN